MENVSPQYICDQINQLVKERFEVSRQVVLLSFIGQHLSKQGINIKDTIGETKLSEFIRENMSGHIELINAPFDEKIVAAYPAGIDIDSEIDPFGINGRNHNTTISGSKESAREKRKLINKYVWICFTHHLQEDKRRFIHIGETIFYQDVSTHDIQPDLPEIDKRFIVSEEEPNGYERNEKIYNNIVKWADENNIDFVNLLDTKPKRHLDRSLLDAVLGALTNEQKSQISLSLDVIERLNVRRA